MPALRGEDASWTLKWTGLMMAWCTVATVCRAAEKCNTANSKCVQQVGCGMALHNYLMNCGQLIHGDTDQCSPSCQKAIVSLLSTQDQEGHDLMRCDCQDNPFCVLQKERLEVCSTDVMAAMATINDPTATISCSLAELICNADTPCHTAMNYYRHHCTKMLRGERCNKKCNNSLAILYRQPKASKLRTCHCDGTEEYDCQAVRANTQRLCFDRQAHRLRHHGHASSTVSPAPLQPTPRDHRKLPASHSCQQLPPSAAALTLSCMLAAALTLLLNLGPS